MDKRAGFRIFGMALLQAALAVRPGKSGGAQAFPNAGQPQHPKPRIEGVAPCRVLARPPLMPFDYDLDFAAVDFRRHPELYRVGKGEQGVLLVQPYKGEILPHWRFRTPEVAQESADMIYGLFEAYLKARDFVGADMARKFLQMGYTRARRYANHRDGKKYDGPVPDDKKGQSGAHGRPELPRAPEDPVKAESATIFKAKWDEARAHPDYQEQRAEFQQRYGK